MNLKPTEDRIVVKEVEHKTTSVGGLFLHITETVKYGVVLAVGPGRWQSSGHTLERVPPAIQVGDTVVFSSRAVLPVMSEGETYLVMTELDVIATLNG